MMGEVILDFDIKKLEKLKTEAPKRAQTLQRMVTRDIARDAHEQITALAPQNDPDVGSYADDLEVYQLQKDAAFAVLHNGKSQPTKVVDLDAATTILDIRLAKRAANKTAFLFRLVAQFGPYTVNSWPQILPKDDAFVVYRRVRPDEVKRVLEKNQKDQAALTDLLRQNGVAYKPGQFKIEDVEAVNDLQFQVIRKEFGLGTKAVPHWRPGLRRIRMDAVLTKLENNPKLIRSLLDAEYRGWRQLGSVKNTVSPGDLDGIEEFQKRVID